MNEGRRRVGGRYGRERKRILKGGKKKQRIHSMSVRKKKLTITCNCIDVVATHGVWGDRDRAPFAHGWNFRVQRSESRHFKAAEVDSIKRFLKIPSKSPPKTTCSHWKKSPLQSVAAIHNKLQCTFMLIHGFVRLLFLLANFFCLFFFRFVCTNMYHVCLLVCLSYAVRLIFFPLFNPLIFSNNNHFYFGFYLTFASI